MWNDLIISHNHFFLCCNDHCILAGPVLNLFRRQLEHIYAERNALRLKCNSSDDKLALLRKRLEASESHRAEYVRRYEVLNDKQKISKDYSIRITELQAKSSKLDVNLCEFVN